MEGIERGEEGRVEMEKEKGEEERAEDEGRRVTNQQAKANHFIQLQGKAVKLPPSCPLPVASLASKVVGRHTLFL